MQILIHTRRSLRLLIFAILLGGHLVSGQTFTAPEYKIKAAFLYNFAILTEWPASAFASSETPLTIGILGENPFDDFLQATVEDKTVFGREIIIRNFSQPSEINECHLLFVSTSEEQRIPEIICILKGQPILTVSESESFQQAGGMIRLFREKDKIRFTVNKEASERAGLELSSRLLALGREFPTNPQARKEKE